ncbi:hypothetical protein FXB41_25700 [Bradyrhizobium canariense]|uniref:hypothetical protein n=1 Tax=Bradyrhizobium canariense TaxID=255045 RepID=UPI001CA5760C|nr:hypothetical protein [Bradyrhizobium canariense]MBW5438028.1 hypothetical protein [Bradyrhizobium canariense]
MTKGSLARTLAVIGATSLLWSIIGGNRSFGSTYYVSAEGADSHDGITKSTAWLHAPGMPDCSATCATTIPKPGDRFLFRGRETWHAANGLVQGIPWVWTWSGTSRDHIYIGVDHTWFSGPSWSRPVLDMDNPLSTDRPESCAYDDSDITALTLKNVHHVDFDGFEFTGKCWGAVPRGASIFRSGSSITISNSYFHGWTMATHAGDDTHYMILGAGSGITDNVVVSNIFDGSDSSLGTTSKRSSGFGIYAECYDVHNNVFRRLSNGAVCSNPTYVHDNLFEFLYNPVERHFAHGNVVESLGGLAEGRTYFYNNVIRHTNEGVTIWLQGSVLYVFNNVFSDIDNPMNCLMQNPPGFSAGVGSATSHVYNNTFESPCHIHFNGANSTTPSWSGPVHFANNHLVGYSSLSAGVDCRAAARCDFHDEGGNILQTKSQADFEGYTTAGSYLAVAGSTIGRGLNLSLVCQSAPALCGTTTLGVLDGSEKVVAHPANPVRSRPTVGPWNAGAY